MNEERMKHEAIKEARADQLRVALSMLEENVDDLHAQERLYRNHELCAMKRDDLEGAKAANRQRRFVLREACIRLERRGELYEELSVAESKL